MRRNRQPSNRASRALALMGRALLIVSLWNGPLPVIHAHGADIDDSADAAGFAEHLAEYHADVTLNSHIDFGWHWHLVLPHECHPGDNCPDGHHQHHQSCPTDAGDNVALMQAAPASWGLAPADAALSWMTSTPPHIDFTGDQSPAAPTHYLETYLGSVSVGTLLRVSRC